MDLGTRARFHSTVVILLAHPLDRSLKHARTVRPWWCVRRRQRGPRARLTWVRRPPAQTYLEAVKIAEAREADVKAIFDKYDVDNSGTIEMEELLALLDDLGLISKLQTSAKDFAIDMFTKYDANDDGVLR